ncbi:hypothetical protein Tco_1260529 [Tanacetum coccineum]
MDITRDQQIALDDALVAPANRLKIGKSNLRLSSDLNSKEATLQVVYDVLKLTPFYKAFQITTDVPEIYMQEFWATATVHHHSIRFKMNNKKHIVNLEYFREMLQICPKLYDQQFEELTFKEEILTFLIDLGHSGEIKELNLLKKASVKKKQTGFDKIKTPPTTKGKRLKTSAKAAKPTKKKQTAKMSKAKGLTVLSEYALTEAEQMELATKRSLIQTHSSHTSGSGTDEGTSDILGVPDVPTYESDDEQISWKSSEEEDHDEVGKNDDDDDDADNQDDDGQEDDGQEDDGQEYDGQDDQNQDDDNEQTNLDNDGSDLRVHTPSHYESTDDEDNDEEIQGVDVEEEEMDEEDTNEEEEVDELYRDVNVNLEGRDTEMNDAPHTFLQTTQVIEDTHVIITLVNLKGQQQSSSVSSGFISNMLNPSPDSGIDSIFNLNTESTSLVDVLVTTIVEIPLLSATTHPIPPIPLIPHPQKTPIPTPTTVPSSSLKEIPNFGSLFRFDHRLKTLETDFLEFKKTNQFVAAVSSILGIVDTYLANKMHDAVKTVVQLQSDRLRDEAQAENEDFINKLDDNIKKIIKDQVKEQVKAQVSKILPKIEKTVDIAILYT